ncbi:YCF48-related protein [Variovorax sp. YR752]|uniref:WD40/YVTN/BNR-like repeat-containing protein n=1 Tax=Variovorax sp. YR752 TaxID=1884383 RepID=UPI001C53DD73|nr:YCF48-related protein [Variovorax sp. YR752]
MLRYRKPVAMLWLVVSCVGANCEPVQPPWTRPAAASASGSQSVLTGVTRVGGRLVAIGERGLVILSDDQGRTWQQAKVPVSVTLCAVQFVDAKSGWVVGHSGVVLRTHDGGSTWTKQLDGSQIPALLSAEASASGQASVAKTAHQFEQDGPDKPLLDVMFIDAQRGWVVGGYGLILRTDNGGATWVSQMSKVDNPKGLSIYAIATDGKSTFLAGEQGYLARSDAAGNDFRKVAMPVGSSFFTMLALPGRLFVGGLGGVLLDSIDGAASWHQIKTGTDSSIVSLQSSAGRQLLVGGQGGEVMKVDLEQSDRLSTLGVSPARTLHAFTRSAGGQVLTVGFRGAIALPISETESQPTKVN